MRADPVPQDRMDATWAAARERGVPPVLLAWEALAWCCLYPGKAKR